MCKPSTEDGCGMERMVYVHHACFSMASKPCDLLYEAVWGWRTGVFCLLVAPEYMSLSLGLHAGKLGLDPGLALAVFNRDTYRGVEARLPDAGFGQGVNDQGDRGLDSLSADVSRVLVMNFLIPSNEETDEGDAILQNEN